MFCNRWVLKEELITSSFANGIQGACEVYALRTQEQLECHEKRCVCKKVEGKEKPPLVNPEKRQWISPYNSQTTKE
jgi:hypothetical protein